MQVREWKGDIVFLHTVTAGSADRSYGIHVARLAGLPAPVVARAQAVLKDLARGGPLRGLSDAPTDLPLFSAAPAEPPPPHAEHVALKKLRAMRPDEMSPKEALALLYELTATIRET